VFELDYGGTCTSYCKDVNKSGKYWFMSMPLENHIEAMNALISRIFEDGYDVIFNTNMDDVYKSDRFEKQIAKIKEGFQLVSSNFVYMYTNKYFIFHEKDIAVELNKNHNVIAHPCVAMHKSFWTEGMHYNNLLGYEDLDLWKRAIAAGKRFCILPDVLLEYRIHSNQVTKKHNYEGG
jgi:hypothetical protein